MFTPLRRIQVPDPAADQISVPVRTLPLALALLLVLLPQGAAAATEDQIIVKRDAGLSAAERADIRADADVRFVESLPLPQTEVVAAVPGDVRDALRDLNRDPDVVYAELDRPIQALATNDPLFTSLWALENRGDFTFGRPPEDVPAVADADMDVVDAWGITTGAGTTVGVMDSGVDATHPDLAPNLLPGRDFVGNDSTPTDANGHGTHVTGTIAAVKDNGQGVVGVAPSTRIVPLKVLADDGRGTVSDAIEAYRYARDNGVKIVNASFGAVGYVQAERDAIAGSPNTLFVVAAGNDGTNNDVSSTANYPCAYNLSNILCVGASTHNDEPAEFSNFGSTTVDVFAPGYRIWSTRSGGGNSVLDGTSMATPHVTGAAALLLSQNPGLTPSAIRNAIIASADDKPALNNTSVSDGRANANAALLHVNGDADRDSFPNGVDACPSQAGTAGGCPDADSDGRPNASDACPTVPAATANGCPVPLPNGDGDALADVQDACPAVTAFTANGCPVPALTKLSGTVKKRGSRRWVVVRAKTTRAAVLRILVQRKKGRKWVKVKRRTLSTRANRVVLTVNRLRRGRHRVVVAVYSNAGSGTPATRYFTVR